jgi:hypothetical protein
MQAQPFCSKNTFQIKCIILITVRVAIRRLITFCGSAAKQNTVLTTHSPCLSGGTVGKYIGDAIMAFWNSPNNVEGHAAAACAAALEQQQLLAALRRRLATRGLPPLHARMGLSSGTVLHGNIGSRRRMEWNLIGDEVIQILSHPKSQPPSLAQLAGCSLSPSPAPTPDSSPLASPRTPVTLFERGSLSL